LDELDKEEQQQEDKKRKKTEKKKKANIRKLAEKEGVAVEVIEQRIKAEEDQKK